MENNLEDKEKKIVVLPLDENSKEISQILANDTARKILETLAEKPLSATEIADSLELALTTVHYDIKKLQDAGLIRVVDTRASEKLKEVKIYGPEEKFIVIVPKSVKRSDALETLKKILPLIFVAAVFAFGVEYAGMEYLYPADEGPGSMEKGLGEGGVKGTLDGAGGNETVIYREDKYKQESAGEPVNATGGEAEGSDETVRDRELAPGYAEEDKKEIEEKGGETSGTEPPGSVRPEEIRYNPHLGIWFFLGSLLMIVIFAGIRSYGRKH
ncbi:MAG: hypothetical protein A7315_09645 [Candidatus Altiarchaeales archaeon WOR_SM1_79]|nr:MAG: hypothetical protein A7315_09645 [Candidatus Altiarchaeales archaeon WOR_SM1_79]